MTGRPTTAFELIRYRPEESRTHIQCRFEGDALWRSQELIADLLPKDTRTINERLKHIFEEDEVAPEATIRKFRIVRTAGNRSVSREAEHYNPTALLAVGYRVCSHRGTQLAQ